jgi:hypothetical protein
MKVEKRKEKRGSFHILGYLIELIMKIKCLRNFFFPQNLANLEPSFLNEKSSDRLKFEIIFFRCKFGNTWSCM